MQKNRSTNDTRPGTVRLTQYAAALAAALVLAPQAFGAQRPAPPARPARPAQVVAPAPVVAPAAPAAPDDDDQAEPPEAPEPPEPAEAPDMDFDMDMDFDQFQVNTPDVNVIVPMAPMPAIAPMAPIGPVMIYGPGGFRSNWQSRQKFNDVAKETDPARRAYYEGRNFVSDSEWDKAAAKFNEVVTKYSTSKITDAALYWYAYSLKNESRWLDSYTALDRLIHEFPKSQWNDDAERLIVEVAGPAGKPIPPEVQAKQLELTQLIALQSLMQSKPEQAIEIGRGYFKPGTTKSAEFRQKAIIILSQTDSPASVDLLMDAARNDPDAKVRQHALIMLGQHLDDKQRGPQILDVLKGIATGNDAELAKYAIVALSQDDSPQALQFLIQVATSAPVTEVRKQAITMLAQHNDPAACDALARIYDTEKDAELQRLAIVMLAQSDCPQAADKLMQVARTAESVELRRFAIVMLAQKDRGKAVQTLVQMYDSEKNETLKEGIVDGLGQTLEESSDKAALHKLMAIAKNDPSTELRKKAIFWIGQSKDPEATQFLVDLLK